MILPNVLLFTPLVAAALILLATRRDPNVSALVSIVSVLVTLVAALAFLGQEDGVHVAGSWAAAGAFSIDFGYHVDSLSRGMMFVVTFIGALVHLFSWGYMRDDDGRARYFAGLSLFMFSMTGIVLANNFAMMFIFWELVGVSSYLLIGHWFTRPAAAEAAKKAFLVNRIGDFGFLIGILLVWGLTGSIVFGDAATEGTIHHWFATHAEPAFPGLVTAAALCIFCGAVGKSAQFPLHVWLPDAMEGPTPVSALIHAATMVAAGVYMLVRVDFLVGASASAAMVIAWIGGLTALLAALMATQQNDIKRILAYSTLSQLGYMVMAVGLFAGDAAMFHLFTHAFFKALLFLGAGAVIFACHHEQDIWRMGGLRERMPITFWTFAAGTAALVAVPGTSGFWSKEAILESALHGEHGSTPLFLLAGGVAFLTAFYMVRLFVVAFLGSPRTEAAGHASEVPRILWVPLAVLAVPSLLAGFGFIAGPLEAQRPDTAFHLGAAFWTSIVALAAGAGLAAFLYRGRERDPVSVPLLARRFFLDEIYLFLVRIAQDAVASVARFIDDFLIGGLVVRGGGGLVAGVGSLLRRIQTGSLQTYAFLFGLGVILVVYLTVFFRA